LRLNRKNTPPIEVKHATLKKTEIIVRYSKGVESGVTKKRLFIYQQNFKIT